MKKVDFFGARFEEGNTHTVSVFIYPTLKALQALKRYKGQNDVSDAEGFCFQGNKPSKDGIVAEIHLAASMLSVEVVAHECLHAAWIRAKYLGITGVSLEERLATDTGVICERIIGELSRRKYTLRS